MIILKNNWNVMRISMESLTLDAEVVPENKLSAYSELVRKLRIEFEPTIHKINAWVYRRFEKNEVYHNPSSYNHIQRSFYDFYGNDDLPTYDVVLQKAYYDFSFSENDTKISFQFAPIYEGKPVEVIYILSINKNDNDNIFKNAIFAVAPTQEFSEMKEFYSGLVANCTGGIAALRKAADEEEAAEKAKLIKEISAELTKRLIAELNEDPTHTFTKKEAVDTMKSLLEVLEKIQTNMSNYVLLDYGFEEIKKEFENVNDKLLGITTFLGAYLSTK